MKLRNLFYSALCALAVTAAFTSCSDDDDDNDSWREGSKVELPQYRAFILSEGTMNRNDSHLSFFDPTSSSPVTMDIYETQNGRKLGDTANDMIEEDGYIYVVVDVSKLLLKLTGAGVEVARFSFTEELGEPRNVAAENGKLYVTCYGGYIARFDCETLAYEGKVKVDSNPEQIIVHDGTLYTVCSGLGTGNTISVVDTKNFSVSKSYQTLDNPYAIQEDNGNIYVAAYGFYDPMTWTSTPSVGVINPTTKKTTQIEGMAPTRILAVDDKLYMCTSVTPDWISYTTTFSIYDAKTGKVSSWNLKDIPSELTSGNVYMMAYNKYDRSFYIATTDYYSDSKVFHFSSDGSYLGTFTTGGINSNHMLFIK